MQAYSPIAPPRISTMDLVNQLDKETENIFVTLETLECSLNPILKPEYDSSASLGDSLKSESTSPLNDRLNSLLEALQTLNGKILRTNNRVQL